MDSNHHMIFTMWIFHSKISNLSYGILFCVLAFCEHILLTSLSNNNMQMLKTHNLLWGFLKKVLRFRFVFFLNLFFPKLPVHYLKRHLKVYQGKKKTKLPNPNLNSSNIMLWWKIQSSTQCMLWKGFKLGV